MKKNYIIQAYMLDRPGVLNKIAMLIRRKMYNIDTLTVCETEKQGVSKMTISLLLDAKVTIDQIVKQLKKIPEVLSAKDLNQKQSFCSEVVLVKCKLSKSKVDDLMGKYKFEILSQKKGITILQIAGTVKSIKDFLIDVGNENVIETAHSGVTSMEF